MTPTPLTAVAILFMTVASVLLAIPEEKWVDRVKRRNEKDMRR